MIVYHLTPLANAASIRWEGLRIDRAVGLPRVWFFTPSKRAWARQHIAQHKHCQPDELIEFAYNVPRRWLKHKRRGIWVCYRNVSAMMSLDRRTVTDLLLEDSVEETLTPMKPTIVYADPYSLTGAEFPIGPIETLTGGRHG